MPKTIDNDLAATDVTFGFDTAVATATDAIDKLHSTAESHDRVMVVEVMGRYCGWIALHAGMAGSADVILIPEIPFDMEKVCEKIMDREAGRPALLDRGVRGGRARRVGGEMTFEEEAHDGPRGAPGRHRGEGRAPRSRSARARRRARWCSATCSAAGSPPRSTACSRCASARRRCAWPKRAAGAPWSPTTRPEMTRCRSRPALASLKTVPVDCDTVRTARELGISLRRLSARRR